MITTVLAFLVTLAILVVVHEYGHYRVAVACGVKVLRFSVGFGRVLWRRQSAPDATEFVVSALPLGGYVRMLDEREAPVPADELHRAFNRQPLWRRAAIVIAGPAANLLLAVLLFAAAQWIGTEEARAVVSAPVPGSVADRAGLRSGDWVRAVSRDGNEWTEVRSMNDLRWQITQAVLDGEALQLSTSERRGGSARTLKLDLPRLGTRDVDATLMVQVGLGAPYSEAVMGEVKAGGPAASAGLRAGDRVLNVDGQPVADAQVLRERIRQAVRDGAAQPMRWQVDRDGRLVDVELLPRVLDDNGTRIGRVDAFIGQPVEMVTVRRGMWEGLQLGVERTWELSVLTIRMLGRMLIGEASLRNLSGPLTIADYAGQSAQQGIGYYLGFLALVSVSLGVLNLLPLPMLDGGHLMYYLFEGLTGRPVSELWLGRLQRGGIAILLALMSVALFNDVARLLGLH
ncbi:MAG: RIP metalloprotease RseP [Burkholderiaceae bacterium]|jgi:regulator of sigma E protease|nr:RIP metalloprotease RseP [Burkholderiaceae bacterium]